ncbi:MAG: hypothetical protein KZQ88_10550, partial [Candidatus Thiodiazotropha sp. (ex Dulcina madagascariensis)]|nr:hypothetical protein [Candidatus Thiodiazotropha sp. (ex Dulcina madagascariensis)]
QDLLLSRYLKLFCPIMGVRQLCAGFDRHLHLPSCFKTVRLGRTLRLESLFSTTGRGCKMSLAKLAKYAKKTFSEDPLRALRAWREFLFL